MSERMSKEERARRRERWEQVFRKNWSGDPGELSATQTALEECMEDLDAADSRIAELEVENEELRAEVEKGYMLVRSRENKIAKKMSQIKEIANRRIEPYTDQIRQQGQVIEGLKAARAEDAERIPKLESEVEQLEEDAAAKTELERVLNEAKPCLRKWADEEMLPQLPGEFFDLLSVLSEVARESGHDVPDIKNARWM